MIFTCIKLRFLLLQYFVRECCHGSRHMYYFVVQQDCMQNQTFEFDESINALMQDISCATVAKCPIKSHDLSPPQLYEVLPLQNAISSSAMWQVSQLVPQMELVPSRKLQIETALSHGIYETCFTLWEAQGRACTSFTKLFMTTWTYTNLRLLSSATQNRYTLAPVALMS